MPKILVIGCGLAGLAASVRGAELGAEVVLVAPSPSERSQSVMAMGGINGALNTKGQNDSVKEHYIDTIKGGNGLIAEARINVKNQLASIAVTTPPNKTLYSVGSAFDKTGMVVTAYYKDGTSKVVTNYTIESSVTRYGRLI